MRTLALALSLLAAACGGGSEDELKVERDGPPQQWIRTSCGGAFCTLTIGTCAEGDSSCKVCDPAQTLQQCALRTSND